MAIKYYSADLICGECNLPMARTPYQSKGPVTFRCIQPSCPQVNKLFTPTVLEAEEIKPNTDSK